MIPYIDRLDRLADEKLPVMVWFTVPGCRPCRAAEPKVDEFIAKRRGEVKAFRYDIAKSPEIPQGLDITSTPTFIFYLEGVEAGRLDGVPSVSEFEETLDKIKKEVK